MSDSQTPLPELAAFASGSEPFSHRELGKVWLVTLLGRPGGRSRFVHADGLLTPWRYQARMFREREQAVQFAAQWQAPAKARLQVCQWADAWYEALPAHRWAKCKPLARKPS